MKGKTSYIFKTLIVMVTVLSGIFLTSVPWAVSADSKSGTKFRFALVMPGSVQDADFNTNGFLTLQKVKATNHIDTAYSENVPVSDAGRVAQEYIGAGYNIVGFWGGQFRASMLNLVGKYPDVTFTILTGGKSDDLAKPNIWNVARKWHTASYPFGVLAAKATKNKKVGYIGGVKMADYVGALNAINDAIKATNPTVKLVFNFVGDFNDPIKTRQVSEAMINDGVDFIIGQINLGYYGLIEAAKAAKNPVLIAGLYSDKSAIAPQNYTTALLINHDEVFVKVIKEIMEGKKGGYFEMNPGSGMAMSLPIRKVPEDAAKAAQDAYNKIAKGEIKLEEKNKETP